MRVATALGFLALAAMAVHAQTTPAVVTNTPALGQRVNFLLDPNMPTTGAISITESGTTWIVYGTTNTIQWYNSSCVMQGTPDPATWSTTGCVYNVSSMYPVTALIKTATNMFWAVANDTLTLYTAQTVTKTFTVSGSSFDLAALSYPSNPAPRSHTVWNGFLYLGSRNVNGTGMSAVRKIAVSTGTVSWTAWSPNPQSNYPVSIATLTGGTTVAVAQSSTTQDAVFAPFDDSTGAAGNATLSLTAVENGSNGCGSGYICNVAQFTTTTVNGIFYIASTTLNAQLIAVDFTTGFWATVQSGLGGSNSNVLSAFGTWIFLAKGGNLRLIDTTKIPVTALTKTGGIVPSASYNTASLTLPGYYTPYAQAVIYSNTTNTFWIVHTAGISTATVTDFQTSTTTTATVWWWYWFPFTSGTASSGYTQMNVQGAWVDASNPSMLYATWGNSFTGYTATGSAWGFNTTSKMAAWRFGDNYDARGPAIWVPATNSVGGLWYGVANAANSVYGRRVLLGWAADASLSQLLPNVASSSSTWSSDTMHLSYSNISGLLSVVSYSDNTLTLYNATTLTVNSSYTTTSSSYNVRPSQGVITVGTMHCASTYYNLRCVDWVSGASSSFTLSSNSIAGQPIVVGNRFVIARDSYYTVTLLDMSAKSPTPVTLSVSSGNGYINAQPAGWLATDGSLVVAVPMSGAMMRVFYGAETASPTSVDIATSGTGLTTATPYYTTNAIAFGGYLWVAGNLTRLIATGSNTYTNKDYGQITRIPVSTATVAKAYTKAQASLWVMQGTDKVGTIKNLFSSPLFPTMLFTLGATFTGWDTTTGNTYFSVAPLPGLSYFTASNSAGNYDYFPTVDPTNRGVVVGMINSTTNVFAGWAMLSPLDGTMLRLVPNPANSATGLSFVPQSPGTYNGNSFIMSGTHICEYSTLAAWPADRVPTTQDPYDARVCTTVLGLNPTYGFLHIGDWYFVLINGILVKSMRLVQYYQSMVPFTISGSPGGAGGNAPADDDSKAPVIIGVIVAIVIVAIIVVVVVKKLGSGGGSGSSQGTNYNEMGGKGV